MAQEKLTKFILEVAYPRINDELLSMDKEFQTKEAELKEKYLDEVKKIFLEVQSFNKQLNKEITYFSFTFLRSNILYGKNICDVHIYDKEWYLNDYTKVGEIDVTYFFGRLAEIKKYLLAESRKYVVGINVSDIDNIILQSMEDFNQFFVRMIQDVVVEAVEGVEYEGMMKTDDFKIYTGELYGEPIVLYDEAKKENVKL